MARADYYILPEADHDSRELFLCRLCEKVLEQGLRIYIQVASAAEAQRLDAHLWSFRADAFVPHGLLGNEPAAPIEIGYGDQLPTHREVYVNLALDLPEPAFAFERIVEVVVQDQAILDATRRNYQNCRNRGLELNRHDMRRAS